MIKIDEMIEFLQTMKLEKSSIDRKLILKEFNRFQYNRRYKAQLMTIACIVEEVTGINVGQMMIKTSKTEIVTARQLSMYFMSEVTKLKPHIIGNFFATKRHHFDRNSVNHSIKKVQDYCDTDKWYRMKFEAIQKQVNETFLIT